MSRGTFRTNTSVTTVTLVIILAASVVVGISFYTQQAATIDSLSSVLAEKSLEANQQRQALEEYTLVTANQQQELEARSKQLESLRAQISALNAQIDSQNGVINQKTSQVEQLQAELLFLEDKAAILEKSIEDLRIEINAKDKSIENLSLNAVQRVHIVHYGLGVNEKGEGVVFPIEVEIIDSGDGRISLNVSDVQFQQAFQGSVRTAAAVASSHTGISVSDKDIIVTLINERRGILTMDGPSAGAVITAMIVAGLQEKQLDSSILVTGAIKPDGAIGRVGGLSDKANAAVAFGANTLLVPEGQEWHNSKIAVIGVSDTEDLVSRIIVDR